MAETSSDLFLLHPSVAAVPEVSLVCGRVRDRDRILVAPVLQDGSWTSVRGEELELDQALEQRLEKRQSENLIAIFWPSWDTDLEKLREFLSGQPDYRISDLVVISGPTEPGPQAESLPNDCEVLFVGNEDHEGKIIDEGRRAAISADLLLVMMDLGLGGFAGNGLKLFGEDPSLRVAGESESSRRPFCSFGLEAWFPRPRIHLESVRVSLGCLLKEDFEKAAGELNLQLLKKRPSTRIEELKAISTAGLGGSDDGWPEPFESDISRWKLPLIRKAAQALLERRIEEAARQVEQYRRGLVAQLNQWGPKIRALARKELERCLESERVWLESHISVGRLAHLLLHYYPGYSDHALPYLNDRRAACLPCDAPDAVETARHFHAEALELATRESGALPGLFGFIAHLAIPVVAGATAWWFAFDHGLAWGWQVAFPSVGVLYAILRFWLWCRKAKSIIDRLAAHYRGEADRLADIFREKLLWLRSKAALAVARQFAARNRHFGGRLTSMFEQAFQGWMKKVRDDGAPGRPPDDATLKVVRAEIGNLAKTMVDAAGRSSWNAAFSAELAEQLGRIAERTYARILEAGSSGVAKERALEAMVECQGDRGRPILTARIAESELDPRIWVRCLPSDHDLSDEHLGRQRSGFAGDRFVNLRGGLPGPALLCLKRGMSREQFEKALSVSEIR